MTDLLERSRKLEEQLRADDAAMTPPPWLAEADCLYHDSDLDGTILLATFAGDACVDDDRALARTRNALPVLADALRDLRAEVERLTGCMSVAGLQCFMRGSAPEQVAEHMRRVSSSWMEHETKLTTERDAALARVKELEAEASAMRPVVEAASDDQSAECSCDDYGSWNGHNMGCGALPTSLALEAAVNVYRARKP